MSIHVSLLLGALLGAVNLGAALWVLARATALGAARGMQLVLGGMVARMGIALGLVALVLVFLPVHRVAFVSGLGVLFAVGLAVEILFVMGREPGSHRPGSPRPSAPRPSPDA